MNEVLVIGESCQDIFVYCEANRLAPDLPIPILHEKRRVVNPGMAANVHRNLLSREVNCSIQTNRDWERLTKTRYVHEQSNHTFFRVDSPLFIEPIEFNQIQLNAKLVVISDYDKGFLSEDTIQAICRSHPRVFLDTKKKLGPWAEDATFIKINDFEYNRSLSQINEKLFSKVIHTRGSLGCDYLGINFPVPSVEVRDTSGAGDSFLAALTVSFLRHEDIIESIKYANLCASKVVQQRGVGVI